MAGMGLSTGKSLFSPLIARRAGARPVRSETPVSCAAHPSNGHTHSSADSRYTLDATLTYRHQVMSTRELSIGWIVGSVLLLLSFWLCALNAGVFWKLFVRKVEAPSWIPLIGGVLGVFGLGVIPLELAHKLCWLPLLLDWGSLPGF